MRATWLLAFFLLCLSAASAFAEEAPRAVTVEPAEVFQGGIARIKVSGKEIAGVKALLGDKQVMFYPAEGGSHSALLGVDLEQRPGPIEIRVQGWNQSGERWEGQATIQVRLKEFPQETLSVPADFDRIDSATRKRIEMEQTELDQIWKIHSPRRLWEGGFLAPVPGGVNSPFGLRRVINGAPRSPHGGVDLKAGLGADVVAANHGRVVLRKELLFSGKSIVLDHGGGLYTMYFHLSDFGVEKNSRARKGDVIGWVGMTGRVTGPHLHWGARLTGARVDPFALLEATDRQ